ncbi:hypothetical protein CLCR_03769 [Cladophialophora carrionii]|uniref:Uncharacterized protein n=1 Tax=Cladophialophora carrionii TaxID=86049 RepID=A0A1C1CGI4_9EURO|nr:hypothetical protein CLCR_03769 [Cladophialophora carrionii]
MFNLIVPDGAGTKGAFTFGKPVLGALLSTQLGLAMSDRTFLDVQCIFTATAVESDHRRSPLYDVRIECRQRGEVQYGGINRESEDESRQPCGVTFDRGSRV